MAKLIVLALAFAFAALVAFATAQTTIFTTIIEDENPVSQQRQCSQRLQGQRFNQCRMYLQQGQSPFEDNRQQQGIQQCCQELQNIEEQCQCEAVKKVFRDVQQQQGQFGSQQTRRLKQKAQMLPNQCNLQARQCQIGTVTTTTTVTESNFDIPFLPWPFGGGGGSGSGSDSRSRSQQCMESEIQRPVSQCQRYVQQQIRSPRTLLMSINRPGQQQQGLQQCCNELQNVRRECQCQAVEEVARKVMRQQQGGRRQYGGQQDETRIVRRVVQNLPNQCYLEVQQCNIPYEMF
ncbi:hypothetical protein L1987_19622 [Smallanthus sonchifolius]|uniref:Uncharacterized protein n=1 Tax=Smallanthus sonchifolius TaxID=185202 RepID=A0ACB9IRD4_9ASTR|nr:hypothetical protein L1987_19622 [Smallanthus sonchifolius]